jgi:hypothetical protein
VERLVAREVYQILVEECGAPSDADSAESFLYTHRDGRVDEYRFGGSLGYGGKFWQHDLRVSCYKEDDTPERLAAIARANTRLAEVKEQLRAYAIRVAAAGDNRVVHGMTGGGAPIVRYGRSGKWYVEPQIGKRQAVTIAAAVSRALTGEVYLGRFGGTQFDAKVRKAQQA